MPADGGAQIPDAAFGALEECDQKLRDGEFRSLAASMDRIAAQTEPETVAVCRLCGGVAKINLERIDEGLEELSEAEGRRGDLPESVRPQLDSLLFSGQVVGYAAQGNAAAVQVALGKLAAVDPARAAKYAQKCDVVKPEGSDVPCEVPEPKERTRGPESSPAGTEGPPTGPTGTEVPPPSPTETGPEVVTSPPVVEPPGGESPPVRPDTEPPPEPGQD